jgi:predicted TIM-barrel fold metal-dependent hydrolase
MIENYFIDTLMFATDYPHWDSDFPDKVLKTLSDETRQKVFYDNARSVLRL